MLKIFLKNLLTAHWYKYMFIVMWYLINYVCISPYVYVGLNSPMLTMYMDLKQQNNFVLVNMTIP